VEVPKPSTGPVAQSVDRQSEGSEEASVVRGNRRRAGVLCVTPGLLAGAVVGIVLVALGLPLIGVMALVVVAVVLSVWLWRAAPGIVMRSVGGQPSDEWEYPRLHNLVDGLCATMGLPRPTVCIVDSPVPNAMAVGRDPATALLVVTSGLDRSLTLVELEGVLAHELVHIKRHDTVVAALAVVTTIPWAVVAGTSKGADRVHTLIGRGREFSADQRAAGVVRYPPGLCSALEVMMERPAPIAPWPPGNGRAAALTRWLWIDALTAPGEPSVEGNLDDTGVRAAALSLR
jgi:Zn-dependent protease with chaperone function